ncbi:MAG TPA: invasin domain 3-containing protein, partial [Gemmatimonadota bacterium]|nr:invasin domain 3-containing protein [Gemmatimonadota bacterium]
ATVTFAAGDADRLQFQQQPTNTTAGAAISPAVTVRAVDGNNNTVTTFNGSVTLSIGTNPGGGTLSGTTTRTAVNGVATFNDLSIDKAGTGYTLVADGGGLAGATSSAFNITPAAPSGATSTISADPDAIPADGTSTSTITVQLEDSFGNELTTGGASVTLSASAGTLSAVTDNGDGTYTASLRSSTTSQTANVTGTVNGQAIADNATVTFTSGSAASLEVLVQPSATPAGQAITPPVRVRVTDADGNTVLGFSGDITVELSESPAGGVLSGTLTTAAVDGVATFGSLSIDRAGNGYVLRFTSSGVASVSSTPFSITAGAASPATTTITANPSAIPADGSSTATITVQTRDATGADIRSGGDAVTLTTTAGILGPVRDNGNGTYTATLTSSTSNVTATIRGTLNGASIVDTATVTFASGFADLSISVEVSDDEPSEGETVVYTVTVRNDGPDDAAGVAVSDNLPPDRLTFVSAEASQGTYSSASGVWNVGALARGASATLEITVTVNP